MQAKIKKIILIVFIRREVYHKTIVGIDLL